MRPNPGRSRCGPVWPNAEIRTMTSPGFSARRASYPSPQRSRVPGRKFSATTSTSRHRRRISACPAGSRRLQVIDFLLRASESHQRDTPSTWRPSRRRSSPTPGCSTLMTSAPNSPRSVAHMGAAMNVARSRTTRPSSAPTAVSAAEPAWCPGHLDASASGTAAAPAGNQRRGPTRAVTGERRGRSRVSSR